MNDNVGKQHFDLAKESINIGTEVLLVKIGVEHASGNLRVDATDALKFGIK